MNKTVAYLVNVYPKVSHSFIRREIRALEALGVNVVRYTVRPSGDDLPDAGDREEAAKTRVILGGGLMPLLKATARAHVKNFGAAVKAWKLTWALGYGSEMGLSRHIYYHLEACLLAEWLKESGATHLHAHFGTNPAAVAALTHVYSGIPYSFTVHGPQEFDNPIGLALGDKIALSSFVVAISSFGRSQLYRWCRHEHWPKVQVVHCGLDAAFLDHEAGGAAESSDSSSLHPDPNPPAPKGEGARSPRLVCVGRLCEQKGQLLLVEAAARLFAEGRDFQLVLVGDGEMRGEIEALCFRHGITKRVTITGWASSEQVRKELLACDAMVLPSFAEGLPVAIMEAMAVAKPVITTSIAGIPELVTPECGWLVPAGSIEALVDAMRSAVTAPAEVRERMGAIGRRRVRERHDALTEAKKLVALFNGAAAASVHAERTSASTNVQAPLAFAGGEKPVGGAA